MFDDWDARLTSAEADTQHRDQQLGVAACREALTGVRLGNYGVGAALAGPDGTILERGHNSVFTPRFRSDLHAEMVVLNAYEDHYPEASSMRGHTLLSSLEPCPMCLGRILSAGVETVKFLAYDEPGGMVSQIHHLPAAWQRLALRQTIILADVSESLRQFARDVFLLNLEVCRQRLLSR